MLIKLLLPALLVFGAFSASAATAEPKSYDDFVVGLGASFASSLDTIQDKNGEDNPHARMVGDRQFLPAVQFGSLPRPFIDVWGLRVLRWSFEIGAASYKTSKQIVDRISDVQGTDKHNMGNEVELGTGMNGMVGYLNPTVSIFQRFSNHVYVFLGFGYGLGFASVNGDYYVTSGPDASAACLSASTLAGVQSNCARRSASFNRVALGTNVLLGASLGPVGMRYRRGGPMFSDGKYYHNAQIDSGEVFLQLHF